MHPEHEDRIDPHTPALRVLYGRTSRKVRPLEGELTVIGRAPGCDLGLVSPEVAPVHCVIVRLADGWRIRDCSGRSTRLNGRSIRDEPLRHGDTIQVGTFSFEAHLPAHPTPSAAETPGPAALTPGPAPAAPQPDHARVARSRRRLAEHALRLRRQLIEQQEEREALAQLRSDLERQEGRLRAAGRDLAARQQEAEQALQGEREQIRRRTEELSHYATHLRRLRDQLQGAPAEPDPPRLRADPAVSEDAPPEAALPGPDRDTRLDPADDRLASARRLLQRLAERRQAREGRPV